MKIRWVVLCCIVTLVFGISIGWSRRESKAMDEMYVLYAINEMTIAGLSATVLEVMDEGEPERAHRALRGRLDSAVDNLYRLPEAAFEFPDEITWPNMRESMRRATDYLATDGGRYSDWADEVWQRIEKNNPSS